MKYVFLKAEDYLSEQNKFLYRDERTKSLIFENKKCYVRYTQQYSMISIQESKNSGAVYTIKPTRKIAYNVFVRIKNEFNKNTTFDDMMKLISEYGKPKKYYNFS